MTDKEFKMIQDEQMVALESTWDLKPPMKCLRSP